MTIIPTKAVELQARTDADFVQDFVIYDDEAQTTPKNLAGWTFRWAARKDVLDASDWLAAEGAAITVTPLAGAVTAKIERAVLLAALGAGVKRQAGEWALQGTGPDALDAVWAAGAFVLSRGL